MEYGGWLYYYYYNVQGDVLGLFDDALNVVVEYTYDSWGNILSVTGSKAVTVGKANPFRYRGYYYDEESGLYYLQSRYYDPATGRFLNADGVLGANADMATHNLYVYCGNNPIAKVDYNGEFAVSTALFFIGVVGVVGGWLAGGVDRANAMLDNPTPYNVVNWITNGAAESVKGTLFPEKPFSAQHWLDSASTAFMMLPAVRAGSNLLTSAKTLKPQLVPPKITATISNDIINLPRTGSALKTDAYHAFPDIVDNYAGHAIRTPIHNATLYQLQGSLNGIPGRFEWIVQNQQVTHRLFVEGGGINGIPIMP